MVKDGNFRELHRATGGAWGGTTVNDAYEDVLIKIFGQNVFTKFKNDNMDDYLDLFRTFEVKKRVVSTSTAVDTIISMPTTLVETYTKETNFTFEQAIDNSSISNVLQEKGNKLIMKAALMKDLFSVTTDNITKHISDLLCLDAIKGVKIIIMVGGLSESRLVQETVKNAFPNLKVVVPPNAVLSVIKGAVVFGYRPTAITERISKYTYGIEISLPFQDSVLPANKLVVNWRGKYWREHCFYKIIECGREIKLNQKIRSEDTFTPAATTNICFPVYGSTEPNPTHVSDDSCFFVGDMDIDFPDAENPKNLEREFQVYFILGDTEIRFEAKEIL